MTWAVFYTLNRQRDLGDTTHKIQYIKYYKNYFEYVLLKSR